MKKNFFITQLPYIVLGIGLLLGLYRLWYFVHSAIPFGYDPGIYKEYFSHYRSVTTSLDFSQLPHWIRYEPLLGIIAAFFNKLGVSFDRMLTRGIGLLNLIPGLLLFRYFKSKSKNLRWGVLAAVLYRTSIAQYQVFWSGYFKQTLGVSFMLLVLIFWEKKKIWFQSVFFFLLVLLHKHTALYTWAILAVSTIVEWITTKKLPWKKILYRTIAGAVALLLYIPLRGRIMGEAVKAVGEGGGGDFITPLTYIKYSWPIIVLSLCGLGLRIKERKWDVWMLWYGIGILWIALSLVNYNRTLVFLDVFVVVFAAYFLFTIFQSRSSIWKYASFVLLLWWSIHYIVYVNNRAHPLISQEEFSSIQSLATRTEPNAIIMTTHRNYSPRIIGRAQRTYINPGMSDSDAWTHEQRNQWRAGDGKLKCDMLNATYAKLARPLYIRLGSQQFVENLSGWTCFSLIKNGDTWILYKVVLQ